MTDNPESTDPGTLEPGTPDKFQLDIDERRVIGVLIEKSLTTPQYYPLTVNAMITGCNQKSNRDPVLQFVESEVDEILLRLQKRGLATEHYGSSGRTVRWRQEFTYELEFDGPQMAVVAELLLRGPQTLGELRTRANRMKKIADLETLESIVEKLAAMSPPRVIRLSPPGQKRGVRYTHGFYPQKEFAEVQQVEAAGATLAPAPRSSAAATVPADPSALEALKQEVASLAKRVAHLEDQLGVSHATGESETSV